jgi:hypothetical protein
MKKERITAGNKLWLFNEQFELENETKETDFLAYSELPIYIISMRFVEFTQPENFWDIWVSTAHRERAE